MATRTSFEVHASGCRMVEVGIPARRRHPVAGDVRVRSFVTDIPGAADTATRADALRQLRQRRRLPRQAWVTVWGMKTASQFLRLPPAAPSALEALAVREARKDIAPLEAEGDRASVAVVAGPETTVGTQRKREVSLVAVASKEVDRHIQPFIDAGFVVEGVSTPALALTAVARAHRDLLPGVVAGYVTVTSRATCVAIIRDGLLLFSRELPWGHDGQAAGVVANRLASELKRSILYFKQTFRAAVEAVVLCGDMRNLRALTTPLGAALDVPVQPLDSLVGIDAAAVPTPADQFRAEVASLRLAIAVGADAQPGANLLPAAIRVSRAARTEMARVTAAAAAGLVLVAGLYLWTQRTVGASSDRREQIAAQLARLEPEAERLDALRSAYAVSEAQRATLGALESQGPRMARFVEALSLATPEAVVLSEVKAAAEGTSWSTTVTGVAIAPDATSGQEAVNALIAAMAASPFAGPPVEPPSLRVVSGRGVDGQNTQLPPGMNGVEFVIRFRVAK